MLHALMAPSAVIGVRLAKVPVQQGITGLRQRTLIAHCLASDLLLLRLLRLFVIQSALAQAWRASNSIMRIIVSARAEANKQQPQWSRS